jgi:hypothetical protein
MVRSTGIDIIERGLSIMSTQSPTVRSVPRVGDPRTRTAFRPIKLLVGGYLATSVLTLVAIVLLRHHPSEVNPAVWTRAVIVAASALLSFSLAVRAANGARRAFLRLRIISAVMVVAIAVIIVLPGTFPLWLKIEQGVCGLLLIGVALLVNGSRLRARFATS